MKGEHENNVFLYDSAWNNISPTWSLKNIIAVNPLQGLEDLKFDQALDLSYNLFKIKNFPQALKTVNQITIKWCQAFFDEGQATIKMPNRHQGFYKSWLELAIFDQQIHQNLKENIKFIENLPKNPIKAIALILEKIGVSQDLESKFLTLVLTTLSGWSSYVKYLGQWGYSKNPRVQIDYLAIRLIIISIIWPNVLNEIFNLTNDQNQENWKKQQLKQITDLENKHQQFLIKNIYRNFNSINKNTKTYDAQLIFCIDVRSEPMRKAIEGSGNYETFGFAGFFGVPTAVTNMLSEDSFPSCPVLVEPKHNVSEKSLASKEFIAKQMKGYSTLLEIKKFYQSLKYNFTTPLPLAEGIGIWSGGWMFIKTFSPKTRKFLQTNLKKTFKQAAKSCVEIDFIPFKDQCSYAHGFLKSIGLISNFSKIILLCGHGSYTENNSHATSLDCGACGGRHGDINAKILATILNQKEVRKYLAKEKIEIPKDTKFIAAKHNTTTDEIEIYDHNIDQSQDLKQLKSNLKKAKLANNAFRAKAMGFDLPKNKLENFFFNKSHAWSETQPEWGLARNTSFIVAPRNLTKNINLKGESFLHSYEWQTDEDSSILNLILNAPMIVAQWINSQYLFSTIDNIAFGAGSKITHNIVGKIGVMQGNASDLMHGLPLQSVYKNDQEPYHKTARLATFIYAPQDKIEQVINQSPKIKQLITNQWLFIYCLEPRIHKIYHLDQNLDWHLDKSPNLVH